MFGGNPRSCCGDPTMERIELDGIVARRMRVAEPSLMPDDLPRCAYCGAVIGVYEPLVQVVSETVRTTSRAADPSLGPDSPGTLYHALCHERGPARADT